MSMELLSPAGDWDALVAAVQSGADAVYLGGSMLNARAGAGNFDADALVRACEYAHERDVRVHVTVNTMVKQRELPLVDEIAAQLAALEQQICHGDPERMAAVRRNKRTL